MFYSIVSTKENNVINISCVPNLWIQNNKLWWPPIGTKEKKINKLRANCCAPEPHWRKMKCNIKCTDILTYEDGIAKEKIYAGFTDTESELQ